MAAVTAQQTRSLGSTPANRAKEWQEQADGEKWLFETDGTSR